MNRLYILETIPQLKLGTMARPRGGIWLEDEIKSLADRGVDCLVCLLTKQEIYELALQEEANLCKTYQIDYLSFPITDMSIPDSLADFRKLVQSLTEEVKAQKKVIAHCRMGIGRSSLTIAAILVELGYKPEEAWKQISLVRGLQVPDTKAQVEFLKNYAQNY